MARIQLTNMSVPEMVVALSEGVPGAALTVIDLLKKAGAIDPDNVAGGFAPLLMLDQSGIYGSKIYQLHVYVCGEDLTKTVACLRAIQLGLLSGADLDQAIDGVTKLNTDDVFAKVRQQLPTFAPDYKVVTSPPANSAANAPGRSIGGGPQ